jgi:Ca2+-binding EF-hand superfamily protein
MSVPQKSSGFLDPTRRNTARVMFLGSQNVRHMAFQLFELMDEAGKKVLTQDQVIQGLSEIDGSCTREELMTAFPEELVDFDAFWSRFSKHIAAQRTT